jgi:hypothetical protein
VPGAGRRREGAGREEQDGSKSKKQEGGKREAIPLAVFKMTDCFLVCELFCALNLSLTKDRFISTIKIEATRYTKIS